MIVGSRFDQDNLPTGQIGAGLASVIFLDSFSITKGQLRIKIYKNTTVKKFPLEFYSYFCLEKKKNTYTIQRTTRRWRIQGGETTGDSENQRGKQWKSKQLETASTHGKPLKFALMSCYKRVLFSIT